jgi:hypothetical protein
MTYGEYIGLLTNIIMWGVLNAIYTLASYRALKRQIEELRKPAP